MRSARGRRWWAGVVVALLVLAGSWSVAGAPPQSAAPWTSLENADKYVFLGKSVWDVETGKQVSPTGAPDVFETTRRIVGVTDRVYDVGVGGYHAAGMIAPGRIVMLDGSPIQEPKLDGQREMDGAERPGVLDVERPPAGDLDRTRGLLARGDRLGDVQDRQPEAGHDGGFVQRAQQAASVWGHLVFLWGNFDKEKPIVRLDLASGEMTELEAFRTLNLLQNPQSVTTNVSPGAYRIVYPTASLVYSYDVRTGKSSMFRNKYEILASERGRGSVVRSERGLGE